MAGKKAYLEAFTSPTGEAVYPWLTKPDTEHNPTGVYHTDLSVPLDEAQSFILKLERVRDEFVATLPLAQQQALGPVDVGLSIGRMGQRDLIDVE